MRATRFASIPAAASTWSGPRKAQAGASVDVTEIERLIELMRRAGIMHLALEQPEYRVSITRGAEAQQAPPTPQAEALPPSVTPPPATSGGTPVGSPVVGVVRAAGGGLPRVGERVSRGQ